MSFLLFINCCVSLVEQTLKAVYTLQNTLHSEVNAALCLLWIQTQIKTQYCIKAYACSDPPQPLVSKHTVILNACIIAL